MYGAFVALLLITVVLELILADARDTSAYSKRDARQKKLLAYGIVVVAVVLAWTLWGALAYF